MARAPSHQVGEELPVLISNTVLVAASRLSVVFASSLPAMESRAPMPPDVSQAYKLQVATIITTLVALVLVLLRLYVRLFMIRMFGWDDFWNVMAMASSLVTWGLVEGALRSGIGRHIAYVPLPDVAEGVKLLRIGEFHLILTTVFVKISISLFLKRLLYVNL